MLKASDLRDSNKLKQEKLKNYFKQILQECYNKIKLSNEKGTTNCSFRVRFVNRDMPLINVEQALEYIIRKLKKGGFKVVKTQTNAIVIDWS